MIYLDNAATTLHKPQPVIDAVVQAMRTLGNSARGAHAESLSASRTVYGTRVRIARFFGCPRPDRVVFTHNITEALNIAIDGLFGPGDHVITTDLEHNSVLRPLYRLEAEQGVHLSFVPADAQGRIDYDDFERLMRPETKAVVCTHASNLTGMVVDLARVSRIAHAHGALLIADCAQTAGTRPVDMQALGIDVLCFTGHKGLLGPQGTGGLCIREGVEIRPYTVGGTGVQTYSRTQPEQLPVRLEAGTLNGHGLAGLSAAIDFLEETGVEAVAAKEAALTERFLSGVQKIPGITVYGPSDGPHAGIVSLNVRDLDSGAVADALSEDYGIAVRPGGHCAPRLHEALGTREQGAVRFSFSWFTTEEEVDAALSALSELAAE